MNPTADGVGYVNCEVTGFSPEHDAVIEFAMLPLMYELEER